MSRFTYKNNKYSKLKLIFELGNLSKLKCVLENIVFATLAFSDQNLFFLKVLWHFNSQ